MFRNILLLCLVVCSATCFSRGESTPLLTTQEIIESYRAGLDAGATHMLVIWDTWDFHDSYDFVIYCFPGQNVNDLINSYNAPGFYQVSQVFATHLDIEEQLEEPWHPEYPK